MTTAGVRRPGGAPLTDSLPVDRTHPGTGYARPL